MHLDSMRVAAAVLGVAFFTAAVHPTFAQGTEPKATDQRPAKGENGKDKQKPDEYAEAEKFLGGDPAANPECVWLGKRVVSRLWSDDLDTAFRHLDLYDRFGCPGAHIQQSFRCLVKGGPIDAKATETLKARVHACWINPNAPPAAAAAPAPATAGTGAR
jgi:hypothetical protein